MTSPKRSGTPLAQLPSILNPVSLRCQLGLQNVICRFSALLTAEDQFESTRVNPSIRSLVPSVSVELTLWGPAGWCWCWAQADELLNAFGVKSDHSEQPMNSP